MSWSVSRGTTLDLITVGNTTFSMDPRYSILQQNINNWVLVIKKVETRDEGTYICTIQTFPEQSLMVFVRVQGEEGNYKYMGKWNLAVWPSVAMSVKST